VVGARIAAATSGAVAWEPDREAPVPQVIFSDPEVASVGMTEAEARQAGHDVVVSRVPTSSAAGTGLLRDHVAGESQVVVDATTRLLLGATFVGVEAGELVHAATVAIVGGVPVHVLRHAVASYPTAAELWLRLLEDLPRELRTPPS
jgi:pyruvate/2-oxoglutarate dehydrogenase complex dihydrolipoamide dehydrogenase (E3) component